MLLLLSAAAASCSRGAPEKQPVPPAASAPASASAPLPTDPAAREARIVEIATAHALERGLNRDAIRVTAVKEANGRARVSFDKEPRGPGSHFTVVVDVSSGKAADFIPGR